MFERGLEIAAQNAENILRRKLSRQFEIEVHGLKPNSRRLSKEAAFKEIYLGEKRFYRIIDLSVCRVSGNVLTVYMVVSGHKPGSLDQTWNQPPGSGPFKQVVANEIEVI